MRMMQVRRARKAMVKVMMPTTTKGSNSVIVHSQSVRPHCLTFRPSVLQVESHGSTLDWNVSCCG